MGQSNGHFHDHIRQPLHALVHYCGVESCSDAYATTATFQNPSSLRSLDSEPSLWDCLLLTSLLSAHILRECTAVFATSLSSIDGSVRRRSVGLLYPLGPIRLTAEEIRRDYLERVCSMDPWLRSHLVIRPVHSNVADCCLSHHRRRWGGLCVPAYTCSCPSSLLEARSSCGNQRSKLPMVSRWCLGAFSVISCLFQRFEKVSELFLGTAACKYQELDSRIDFTSPRSINVNHNSAECGSGCIYERFEGCLLRLGASHMYLFGIMFVDKGQGSDSTGGEVIITRDEWK